MSVDGNARKRASKAKKIANSGYDLAQTNCLSRANNVGMRLLQGRIFNVPASSTDTTDELLISVSATNIMAVRVIFVAGQTGGVTATTPTMNAGIRAVSDMSDSSVQSALHKTISVGGATTWNYTPSVSNTRRNYIVSDWIALPPVARTDGIGGSLFAIRAHRTSGQVVVSGNGTDSFSNWATHPSAPFRMRSLGVNTDYANSSIWNGAGSSTWPTANGSSIAGIQYFTAGSVINMIGFGDSITEGRGSYIGEGFGLTTAQLLTQSSMTGTVYEWSNMGWSGQTTSQILQNIIDACNQGVLPTGSNVIVLPVASPNNIGNSTITNTAIYGAAGNPGSSIYSDFVKSVTTLRNLSNPPLIIPWTWLPTNSSVNAYGSSDNLRVNYNAMMRSLGSRGMIIADFDNTLSGVADGTGQIQLKVNTHIDGIHPGDIGNGLLVPVLKQAMTKIISPTTGQLLR